jgi:hypothetical protein
MADGFLRAVIRVNMAFFRTFQVLTAVDMKTSILWDVTPCSLVGSKQHFGETCFLPSEWILRNVGTFLPG